LALALKLESAQASGLELESGSAQAQELEWAQAWELGEAGEGP
jgi:hypothetical protein